MILGFGGGAAMIIGFGGAVLIGDDRGVRVMFEKKENFEKKVLDFMVRVYLALIPCREIETLELN